MMVLMRESPCTALEDGLKLPSSPTCFLISALKRSMQERCKCHQIGTYCIQQPTQHTRHRSHQQETEYRFDGREDGGDDQVIVFDVYGCGGI
jgi:hypothetical protein